VIPPQDAPDLGTLAARLEGALERVVYSDEAKGFSVVELVLADGRHVTVTGNLLGARIGEALRVVGEWQNHPKFGRQVRAKSVEVVPPATTAGLRAYLGSGLVKGVGPALAARIVDALGAGALELIDREPSALRRIPGIGAKKAKAITAALASQRGIRDFVTFLGNQGVSANAALRIWNHYGADALRLVRENPWRLADDVWGFGFRKADEIAGKLGLPRDSPERARAGLLFALADAAGNGHSCLPRADLLARTSQLLGIEEDKALEALDENVERKSIVRETWAGGDDEGDALFLPPLAAAERTAARRIRALLAAKLPPPLADARAIDASARRASITLDPHQRSAVEAALRDRILVITGGPGVGKTTIVRLIVDLARSNGRTILLASPTGRAARRLAEATRAEASTLHRMLEFNPHENQFKRNEHLPLDADAVIVDETSMLDIQLAAHLLRAIEAGTRIVFVGDADQLPSVGPGNFLHDLIESETVPVVRLNRVFRQGAGSGIVAGAHRILAGEMPTFARQPTGEGDLFFDNRDDPLDTLNAVARVVTERIPQRFGLDPLADVQVISPMYRGEAGVDRINRELRARLNPEGASLGSGDRQYRLGDRVMATKNDVDRDVFNGDVGRVDSFDLQKRSVSVRFGERVVAFEESQLSNLVPAYAISVHRSQGSEYPAVVVPLVTQHYVMLRRTLLYTAVTRARKLCVLIGSRRALEIAIHDARAEPRFARLARRLRGESPAGGGA
jgi:exodeoxyribonuclease V alpha subunit